MRKRKFKFYVGSAPPADARRPCFVLEPDAWDDYGYKTLFRLMLFRPEGRKVSIGSVKILPKALGGDENDPLRAKPFLDDTFTDLPSSDFCSLGQTSTYYTELSRLGEYTGLDVDGETVARALSDVCFPETSDRWWEHHSGYETSLLRFPAANVAWREAASLIRGISPEAHDHNAMLVMDVARGRVSPPGYQLRFDGTLELPGRLNVIVGRNGTGKTTLLEEMATHLSGVSVTSRERKPPTFSKVVFVSNNAFDQGAAPRRAPDVRFIGPRPGDLRKLQKAVAAASQSTSEDWPGVRDKLFPTAESLLETLPDVTSLLKEDLEQLQSVPDWASFAERILENEALSTLVVDDPESALDEMSAGQKAMVTILAGLYRELDQQSLALLDEPENYLHPSLVARFVRALNLLLDQRKAFAVVATHSPIIVQETPSRFVSIVERDGRTQYFERPSFETFGESVENIDEYLFETDFGSSHWKKVLSEFAEQGLTDDEICQRLQSRELPLLAQSYIDRRRLKRGG